MDKFSEPIGNLIKQLSRLPGIGRKTAQRLTYYLLDTDDLQVEELANALLEAKKNTKRCSICCNYADHDPCNICSSEKRDHSTICVVEQPKDLFAMEKTGQYHGLYHVLHGVISPIKGYGPDDITLRDLLKHIGQEDIKEVIIATNPTTDGEVTANYVATLIQPLGIKVTRISYGIPMGGDLEYYDNLTISAALNNRVEMKKAKRYKDPSSSS
ncbi:MAG: recombination mediator RecR [Tissierellia bacterium]|nr:recombination mediator RecR [Tissierellia bacterium]